MSAAGDRRGGFPDRRGLFRLDLFFELYFPFFGHSFEKCPFSPQL